MLSVVVGLTVVGFSVMAYGFSKTVEPGKFSEAYKDSSKVLVAGQGYNLEDAKAKGDGNGQGASSQGQGESENKTQNEVSKNKSQQQQLEERAKEQQKLENTAEQVQPPEKPKETESKVEENQPKKEEKAEDTNESKEKNDEVSSEADDQTNSDVNGDVGNSEGEGDKGQDGQGQDGQDGNGDAGQGGQGTGSEGGDGSGDGSGGNGGSGADGGGVVNPGDGSGGTTDDSKDEFEDKWGPPRIVSDLDGKDSWRIAEPFKIIGYDYDGNKITFIDVTVNGHEIRSDGADRYGGSKYKDLLKVGEKNVVEVFVKDRRGYTARAKYEFIGDGKKIAKYYESTVRISLEEIGLGVPLEESVTVYEGDYVKDVIERAVEQHNKRGGMQIQIHYRGDYVPYIYFEGIYDGALTAEGKFTKEFIDNLLKAGEAFGNKEYLEESVIDAFKLKGDSIYRSVKKNIIGEFDYGQKSGWLYFVDDTELNAGIGTILADENTDIEFHYVVDYHNSPK